MCTLRLEWRQWRYARRLIYAGVLCYIEVSTVETPRRVRKGDYGGSAKVPSISLFASDLGVNKSFKKCLCFGDSDRYKSFWNKNTSEQTNYSAKYKYMYIIILWYNIMQSLSHRPTYIKSKLILLIRLYTRSCCKIWVQGRQAGGAGCGSSVAVTETKYLSHLWLRVIYVSCSEALHNRSWIESWTGADKVS